MPLGRGGGLTPPPLPKGILLSLELNDPHLRSHGKIGDCEQSTQSFKISTSKFTSCVLNKGIFSVMANI